jgi:hypothetical protein
MTFDGEGVSLLPSIGNWTLKCRSHYVIDRGKVIEAGPGSDEQVEAERRRDRATKERFYGQSPSARSPIQELAPAPNRSFWRRVRAWITGKSVRREASAAAWRGCAGPTRRQPLHTGAISPAFSASKLLLSLLPL